jgi:hypothetical protein
MRFLSGLNDGVIDLLSWEKTFEYGEAFLLANFVFGKRDL